MPRQAWHKQQKPIIYKVNFSMLRVVAKMAVDLPFHAFEAQPILVGGDGA